MSYTVIDAAIVTFHETLGHDKAATFLGVPAGDKRECHLCHPELGPIDYGDGDKRVMGRRPS